MKRQRGSDEPKAQSYRFKVDDAVLCCTRSGWEPGRIIKLNYQLPGDSKVHPYQVELEDGTLIYCPLDADKCIKKRIIAWWEGLMARDDLSDEDGVALLEMKSKGNDVNAKSYEGNACLHVCLHYGWIPGIKALLKSNADPNLGGNSQERPLNMAVQHGTELVKMLLEAKADPRLQDEDPEKDPNYESKSFKERQWHRSALHYAAMSDKGLAMILLEARADINQADAQYKQPLHIAIEQNIPDVVDFLLANGADLHAGNISIGLNSNPLVEAAYKSDIKLMEKLIAARSDINRRGKQSMTPLHMAARGRRLEAARILVEARADINIEVNGKTAAQLAATNGATELARMLGHKDAALEEQKARVVDAELRKQLYLD